MLEQGVQDFVVKFNTRSILGTIILGSIILIFGVAYLICSQSFLQSFIRIGWFLLIVVAVVTVYLFRYFRPNILVLKPDTLVYTDFFTQKTILWTDIEKIAYKNFEQTISTSTPERKYLAIYLKDPKKYGMDTLVSRDTKTHIIKTLAAVFGGSTRVTNGDVFIDYDELDISMSELLKVLKHYPVTIVSQ